MRLSTKKALLIQAMLLADHGHEDKTHVLNAIGEVLETTDEAEIDRMSYLAEKLLQKQELYHISLEGLANGTEN